MSKRASVDDCRLIRLPKHERENGNITVVENDIDLPFAVKRVYYLYDVPGGEERAVIHTSNYMSFWWRPVDRSM